MTRPRERIAGHDVPRPPPKLWRCVVRWTRSQSCYRRLVTGPRPKLRRNTVTWVTRLFALLMVVISLVPAITIDPDCLVAVAGAEAPCEDDGAPCPCPLDCPSCVVVRAVPGSPADLNAIIAPPPLLEAELSPLAADGAPASPDPGEIAHIPKA